MKLTKLQIDKAFEKFILESGKLDKLPKRDQKILNLITEIDTNFAVAYTLQKKEEMMVKELNTPTKKKSKAVKNKLKQKKKK